MADDKDDESDKAPAATPATSATNAPKRYNRGKDGTHPLDKSFKLKPEGVVEELGGDELQKLRITWNDKISFFAEGDFWRDLEAILANCDEIMLRHSWDRKAGSGRDFPSDRTAELFSELWYAGKIGFECWNLLTWHREHGPNEIALSNTLYLGKLLTEAEWRGSFKPSIITGMKQRKSLAECRSNANNASKLLVEARRDAILTMLEDTILTHGALEKYLEKRLLNELDINASCRTIRRDIKAIKSK